MSSPDSELSIAHLPKSVIMEILGSDDVDVDSVFSHDGLQVHCHIFQEILLFQVTISVISVSFECDYGQVGTSLIIEPTKTWCFSLRKQLYVLKYTTRV